MATYSLIHEPWIPIRPLGGGPVQYVGLRDVLLRAAAFERIDDPSPLVTVALYRLCLAVLHRALQGPEDVKQAAGWYRDGAFPQEAIERYLHTYGDRFDLFHLAQPFMQDWRLPSNTHSYHWSLIASEHGSYNTNFLYGLKKRIEPTHPEKLHEKVADSVLSATLPAEAARHLLQHLTFALGGRTTGVSESQSDSPAASTALVMAEGRDLHESLCLNLLPYSKEQVESDLPPWEWMAVQPQTRFSGKHAINGFADRYTWLSRGVRLQPDDDGAGIHWVAYGGGVTPIVEAQGHYLEPMAAYVKDKKDTLRPIRLDPDKLLWRDFTALLPGGEKEPLTVAHAAALLKETRRTGARPAESGQNRRECLAASHREYLRPLPLTVYGISRSQQKIELYRQEHFTLPSEFITDPRLYTNAVKVGLDDAEQGASALRQALRLMCWLIVTTEADRQKEKREPADIAASLAALPDDDSATAYKGKEVARKVARLHRQLPAQHHYWSSLDPAFREFLLQARESQAEQVWCASIVRAAREGWELALEGLGSDATALKADAVAERIFVRLLSPLTKKSGTGGRA